MATRFERGALFQAPSANAHPQAPAIAAIAIVGGELKYDENVVETVSLDENSIALDVTCCGDATSHTGASRKNYLPSRAPLSIRPVTNFHPVAARGPPPFGRAWCLHPVQCAGVGDRALR